MRAAQRIRSIVYAAVPMPARVPLKKMRYRGFAYRARFFRSIKKANAGQLPDMPSSRRIIVGDNTTKVPEKIPKRIWCYWDELELPELIAASLNNIRRQNPTHQLIILNRHTVKEYVPEVADWRSDLLLSHKADLIRLELLVRYGGIWLDASVLLGRPLDWVHEWAVEANLTMVAFYNHGHSTVTPNPVLENWFIAAKSGDTFITAWRDTLAPLKYDSAAHVFQLFKDQPACADLARRISSPPRYHNSYLAHQLVFNAVENYKMGLLRAEDEAFGIFCGLSKNSWDVAVNMLLKSAPAHMPVVIKLAERERVLINEFKKMRVINQNSLIGRLLVDYRQNTLPNSPCRGLNEATGR